MGKRAKSDYLIQSVSNACDIMECFSIEEDELGTTELARRLGLHKNNVQRLLATLEYRGYVEQSKISGNYRLGLKVFELSQVYTKHLYLFKQARTILEKVQEKCNETTYVGDLRGEYVVYLMSEETSRSVRVVSRVGARFYPHATALGKAILAFLTPEQLDAIYPQEELPSFTPNTIANKKALIHHLEEIREKGYALDLEEQEEGVRCIGVPLFDHTLRVIGGLSISGPITRFSEDRLENELIPQAIEAGQELSQRLGYGIGKKISKLVGELI